MSDKELIDNFLDKNYTVKINTSDVTLRDKFTGQELSYDKFFKSIHLIFGDFIAADGYHSMSVVELWLKAILIEMTAELSEYLNNCHVALTKVGWDVYKPEVGAFTLLEFQRKFGGKFTPAFLETYFDDWRDEKICAESERIMNIF